MPYIGRTLGQGTRSRFLYTATAGQTTFSGSDTQSNTLAYADNNGLDCFQNGVLLKGGGADYTATTGTSVVLTTGASVSDVIEILVYDVFAIADHVKKSGDAMTGALTNIDVNGTELILDADGDTSIDASTDDTLILKTNSNTALSIDANGHITKPLQPAFLAFADDSQSNIASDTATTFQFNGEIFDQGGDFNTSTYKFTAPVTGKYQLQFKAYLNDVPIDAHFIYAQIVTSNRNYIHIFDPRGFDQALGQWFVDVSVLADMDASDTAHCLIYVRLGSATLDIYGEDTLNPSTYFSGFLAC